MKKRDFPRAGEMAPATEVQRVYEVFEPYFVKFPLLGCSCCTSEEDAALLHSKPLQQLHAADLAPFLECAMTVWGDVNDFKHFLPRMLELMLPSWDSSTGAIDTWWLALKLDYANWQTWPAPEVEALREFFCFAWQRDLESEDEGEIEGWFSFLSDIKADFAPFLWVWLDAPNPRLPCHCAQWLVSGKWQSGKKTILGEVFTEAVAQKLETLFFENPDGACAETFAQAADLVHNLAACKANLR